MRIIPPLPLPSCEASISIRPHFCTPPPPPPPGGPPTPYPPGACQPPNGYNYCFDFGTFNLDDPPFSVLFDIHNTLNQPLVIDGFDFLTSVPALWSIDTSACRGKVLQPGEDCQYTVTFIPPRSTVAPTPPAPTPPAPPAPTPLPPAPTPPPPPRPGPGPVPL